MAAKELPEMPAGPVLELHGQRKRFHIPQGLKVLLEEASREVLREQPENIYKFLADFVEDKIVRRDFNTLLGTKDAHRKSWEWRRWSWDGSSLLTQDELLQFLSEFQISLEVAEHLAIIIQSAYRGFLGRQDAKAQKEGRQRRKESLWEEWRHEGNMFVSRRDVEEILAYYGITLFEANAFATKIQAVFRGHYHRQSLKRDNPELAAHLNALGITHWEATQKATKIQSLFRGYKARKQVKEMRDQAGSGKDKLKDGEVMGGEDYEKEYGGEDYGRPGSMAMAKNRYKKTSRQKEYDTAEAKIPAGSRPTRDGDRTEEEEEEVPQIRRTTQDYVDPANPKPKYDAYFPGGVKNAKPVVVDGVEVPPVFSHEHFGEIDPAAIRQKFSTMDFKQRMSQMFKELEETKEDRKREMEMTKKLSTEKVSTEISESRKTSLDQAKSTVEESRKASVEAQARQGASGSRQPSLDQAQKPSDPPVQGPDSRKTSLEQARKASDPPAEGLGSRKPSTEEEQRKASLEQARKPSDPKPAEAHGDKTEVHQSEYRGITDDRKISDETNESIKELLQDTISVTSMRRSTTGSLRSQASIISTASSGTRAANRIADDAIKTAAATKIQSSVRGMQTRSRTLPMLNATKSGDPGAAASASGSKNPVPNEPSGTRGPNAGASAAGSGNPVAANTEATDDDAAIESATAIKIQAKVRGHQARSRTSAMLASAKNSPTASTTDSNKAPGVVHSAAASSTAPTTRSATENQSTKVDKDPEVEMLHDAAATKIQSRVRGMQTRSRTSPMLNATKNDTIWVPTPYPTPNQYRSRSRSPSFYNPELDPRRAPEPEGEDEDADEDVPRLDAAHWAALEAAVASQHGSIFLANVEANIEAGLSEEEAFLTALDEEARLLEVNGTPSQMMLQNRMLQEQERVIETQAAIKIQARVRGMQTRAHLHEMEMEEASEDPPLMQYDPRASIGSAISFYVPGETSNVKKIKEQQEREHPTLKPKKEIPKNKGKVAEKIDEKSAEGKSKPKGFTSITPSLLDLGYPKIAKVNNQKNLPRHQTATYNKKFPAGSRSSALDKFLIPSPAPDSIYASPRRAPEPPTPESEYSESRSEFDLGDYDDDKDDHNYDPPEGVSPEEWKRQLDAVVEDVERRLAKKHLLPYPYHPHPHPLAEMPIRITSQTTVGQHVDHVLERALGVASALDNTPDLVSMPVSSTPSKRKSVIFRDMPEEAPTTQPVSQPQSNTSATVPEPRAILSATTPEKPSISLASMISEMEDEISEEWLDLSFLGIPSDWSTRVQDFLDEQLQLVTGVITGEIPASEAPVQTIGLSVAFVVGMGAGYALLKAVFDKEDENVPVDVAEVLTEVTGTVAETAPKAASATAQGVCKP